MTAFAVPVHLDCRELNMELTLLDRADGCQLFRSDPRIRTETEHVLNVLPLPVGIDRRTAGGIRTLNLRILNATPLPVGLQRRGNGRTRTCDLWGFNPALYPSELRSLGPRFPPGVGVEPPRSRARGVVPQVANLLDLVGPVGLEPTCEVPDLQSGAVAAVPRPHVYSVVGEACGIRTHAFRDESPVT